MADEKAKNARGELRRRHRAVLESGCMADLGSEGRLMLCYALHFADYEKCTLRMSVRGAAKFLGVRPTSVHRGVHQLLNASILMIADKATGGARSVYELVVPTDGGAHVACTPRTRSVSAPYTRRVQSAHEAWTARTQGVNGAHTLRGPLQVIPIGIQDTNGEFNEDISPDSAGREPAERAQVGGIDE